LNFKTCIMKRRRAFIATSIIVVLAGISSIAIAKKSKNEVTLLIGKPFVGDITKTISATGTLQPVDTVAVGAQVSGIIKNIYVDFNSVVKRGQLLAELDPVVLQSQEQQVVANLQQANANLQLQTANYKRRQELYNAGAISKADMESATYQYRSAQDNLGSLQSELRAAQKNLSFTRIYSPIDGTVLSRNISAGQTVAASFNTPTLFSIANDLTHMQVRASVDEADIGNVHNGEKVSFTVDAYPDQTFYGKVEEIRLQPAVSANVVTYTTIIEANNSNLMLKPGMTANINIVTQEQDHALLIPQKATQFVPDKSQLKQYIIKSLKADNNHHQYSGTNLTILNSGEPNKGKLAKVWVQKADTLIETQIVTGLSDDVNVTVLHGLSSNDMVVTGMNHKSSGKSATQERSPFMPARPGSNNRSR
jgi:HlyD family secretion protein